MNSQAEDAPLHAGNCLRRLDVSDNPMTSEVAESLAQMLHRQVHLQILNLNDTGLEDEGVSMIADALVDAGVLAFQPSSMLCIVDQLTHRHTTHTVLAAAEVIVTHSSPKH